MLNADLPTPPSYDQEDIQQILQIAIARKTDNEELSREQLWEIAAELDIEPQALQVAEQEWLRQKQIQRQRLEFNHFRRSVLKHKATRYVIVNTFLIIINLLSAHTLTWSAYILLIWGLGLSLQAWQTFQAKGEAYEQAFENWRFKKEMKQSMATLWDKFKRLWQD